MDDTLCEFKKSYIEYKDRYNDIPYPQSFPGFFVNLKPIEGAIEAYHWLSNHPIYTPYILTAPSIQNPLSYTEKRLWIENHLGMEAVRRLIISPNKGLNKGDYLIDDYTEGKGQETFEGEIIQFGSERFPSWDAVLSYLSS